MPEKFKMAECVVCGAKKPIQVEGKCFSCARNKPTEEDVDKWAEEDNFDDRPPPPPTGSMPGEYRKIRELARRLHNGQDLWSSEDAKPEECLKKQYRCVWSDEPYLMEDF